MKTSDFDFHLPPELVATRPAARRDACRLLALPAGESTPRHLLFSDLPSLLRAGDVLVLNDTRVIPARLLGSRPPGGGEAELLLLEPLACDATGWSWLVLARPGRKLGEGKRVEFAGGLGATIGAVRPDGEREARFSLVGSDSLAGGEAATDVSAKAGDAARTPETFLAALERAGLPPLPPYILAARKQIEHDESPAHEADRSDYQTVFAREGRSVAAPTAGLHFTPELLDRLQAMGVEVRRLRLDVGAGTFKPVEVEDPLAHPMHEERYWIPEETADAANAARREGRRVVSVGTTAARALEAAVERSANGATGDVAPGEGATRIFIAPGHRWGAVDALITNFHLPRSTLLMLVAALRDRETILSAYAEAVAQGYRFYSYGDAMFLERQRNRP